jgi:hypothetical protein
MKRLDLLLDKRTEFINKLIELNVWAANNPHANAKAAIEQVESELLVLDEKIRTLRNE